MAGRVPRYGQAGGETAPFSALRPRNLTALLRARLPRRIVALLKEIGARADGMGCTAFVVGGLVRDLLLGIPNLDVDITVEGDGIAFARAIGLRQGARVKAHERFGTAVVTWPDGFKLDVATARVESYHHPGALPVVKFGSIQEDLSRRDFSINTLAIRLNAHSFGHVIDLHGGLRDLRRGIIRVLHDHSFLDDPVRILRAIRLEQRLGFCLHPDTRTLLVEAVRANMFNRLSGRRLLDELMRLLSEAEPFQGLARVGRLDLLRWIHAELGWSAGLGTLLKDVKKTLDWYAVAFSDRHDRTVEGWLVYMMAMMDGLSDPAAKQVMKRLPFSKRQVEIIRMTRALSSTIVRRLTKRSLCPAENVRLLTGASDEMLLLLMAKCKSTFVKRRIIKYLTVYKVIQPALTGADLNTMGLKQGPLYTRILHRLRDARLNGEVKTVQEERRFVQRLIGR
ncbi:MAG: CCA tRNA nucleotidyltransferase [Nitrospiraceae bacterium]